MKTQAGTVAKRLNGREIKVSKHILSEITQRSMYRASEMEEWLNSYGKRNWLDAKTVEDFMQHQTGVRIRLTNANLEKLPGELPKVLIKYRKECHRLKRFRKLLQAGETIKVVLTPTKTGKLTDGTGVFQMSAEEIAVVTLSTIHTPNDESETMNIAEKMMKEGRDIILILGPHILEKNKPGSLPAIYPGTTKKTWREIEQEYQEDILPEEYYYGKHYEYTWDDVTEKWTAEENPGVTFGFPEQIAGEIMNQYLNSF